MSPARHVAHPNKNMHHGRSGRIPICRMSAATAIEVWKERGSVRIMRRGHAEVWNTEYEAIGFLTKKDLEKFLHLGGRITPT